MQQVFLCFLTALLVSGLVPFSAVAQGGVAQLCAIDGYISGSDLQLVATADETATVSFTVVNNSATYSYGGAELGIAFYASDTEVVPSFWTPLVSAAVFHPQTTQDFEVDINVQHVPAGEYIARLGVAQTDTLAAIMDSKNGTSALFSKQTAGVDYPFTLNTDVTSDPVKQRHTLVAENTGPTVKRDYTQHLAVSRGQLAVGSAVIADATTPVKLIPGKQEVTEKETAAAVPGEYFVHGYSKQTNVALPVVVDSFTVGSEQASADAYITAVGVSGLADETIKTSEIVACISATNDGAFDVRQLELVVTDNDDAVVASSLSSVAAQGQSVVAVSKENLDAVTVTANMYSASGPVPADAPAGSISLGNLQQSIEYTVPCDDNCRWSPATETAERTVVDQTFKQSVWFYLGIIVVGVLLFFLLLGRRKPPVPADSEPMHQPE